MNADRELTLLREITRLKEKVRLAHEIGDKYRRLYFAAVRELDEVRAPTLRRRRLDVTA